MSLDQMRTIKEGSRFDGSKAERELGLTYTPVHTAIQEALASHRQPHPRALHYRRTLTPGRLALNFRLIIRSFSSGL
jgi:N-formylglutamate amidohydrolase